VAKISHKVNKHDKMCSNFVEYIIRGKKSHFFWGKITTYFVEKEKKHQPQVSIISNNWTQTMFTKQKPKLFSLGFHHGTRSLNYFSFYLRTNNLKTSSNTNNENELLYTNNLQIGFESSSNWFIYIPLVPYTW
jgi:hypothetical protein